MATTQAESGAAPDPGPAHQNGALPDLRTTFPVPTQADWRAKAERDLRGKPLSKLSWRGEDGWTLPPVADAQSLAALPHMASPAARAALLRRPGWKTFARVFETDPPEFHEWRAAIEDGYDMVRVVVAREEDASAQSVDLGRVFDDIPGHRLLADSDEPTTTQHLLAYALERRSGLRIAPGFGDYANLPAWNASAGQELALVLAHTIWMLRGAPDPDGASIVGDATAERIAPYAALSFQLGTEVLEETAKLRAARLLWAKVQRAFGLPAAPAFVVAETNRRHMTALDQHTNLLRTTLQGFVAAAGGADAVSLAEYRMPVAIYDEDEGVRLAHNQLRMLDEEAFATRVSDPFGGSYAVELLTDRLARYAWSRVQEIEHEGGFAACYAAGDLADLLGLDDTIDARQELVATRRRSVVGVSRFADPPLVQLEPEGDDADDSEELGDEPDAFDSGDDPEFDPSAMRLSEPFEMLHERVNLHHEETGERPGVLLLPLGPVAARRARADFAADFFRAAGLRIRDPGGIDDVDIALAHVSEHDPAVVVVCSDDASYPELVPQLADRLQAGGKPPLVFVAGRPGEGAASWGVTGFVFEGADVIGLLSEVLDRLGVEESA